MPLLGQSFPFLVWKLPQLTRTFLFFQWQQAKNEIITALSDWVTEWCRIRMKLAFIFGISLGWLHILTERVDTTDLDIKLQIKQMILPFLFVVGRTMPLSPRQEMSHPVLHGLQPTRLLCPWDFPGKDAGVGCHFLFQGIFPTQRSNPGLLHFRQILYQLSCKRSPPIPSNL